MLVDTQPNDGTKFARTMDGKINFDAYRGLTGTVTWADMVIDIAVVDARQRYGHLDLQVTPISGHGLLWLERKNVHLFDDPGLEPPKPAPLIEILLEDPPLKDSTVVETPPVSTADAGLMSLIRAVGARIK
ncbi:MAG: hypothetical protein CMJ62_00400 [Planctomycetaceae bacterium]|jgi:hypothetical protein|nr:hypothetical protein [Planctomycetaceae bacterium]